MISYLHVLGNDSVGERESVEDPVESHLAKHKCGRCNCDSVAFPDLSR